MKIELETTPTHGSFLIRNEGAIVAELSFRLKDGLFYLDHTEVEDSLEGKGIGKALVNRAVEYVREMGLKMVVLCPFAKVIFARKKEYWDVWKREI